jgi:hypothetical protein
MTKKSIIFWLGILALIVAIVGVIYTPFYIASLKDVWYKYFAWFLFLCLILILIIPFALTPYFGMREIKREKEEDYKRDTTKLSIIKEQKNNVNKYVYCRFSHLYLRGNQQIDVEVEWFNGTLFELAFESVHDGIIRIDNIQRNVESNNKRSCQHSNFCNYTITTSDSIQLQLVRDSVFKNKPVNLFLVFSAETTVTYEYESESTYKCDLQCSINQSVIPETI